MLEGQEVENKWEGGLGKVPAESGGKDGSICKGHGD